MTKDDQAAAKDIAASIHKGLQEFIGAPMTQKNEAAIKEAYQAILDEFAGEGVIPEIKITNTTFEDGVFTAQLSVPLSYIYLETNLPIQSDLEESSDICPQCGQKH